ncbi:MAG: hypothetical protein ACW964_10045 [Candidatus Hodarchaeales archaeon]|jgi:hypothetical protein
MVDNSSNESEDKLALGKQLQDIKREKKILKTIFAYYDKLGPFNPKTGISLLEYKTYLVEHGFANLRKTFLADIESKIKNRETELTRMTRQKSVSKKRREDQEEAEYLAKRQQLKQKILDEQEESGDTDLGNLKQLVLIPSWNKLLGTDRFNGFYLNQPVREIIHDNVLILPDFAVTGIEETRGEPFIFLSGVGIYYVQFRLAPGEIITDYREITGIVLPMDIYEKAQDISGSLVSSKDLLMTEFMITIPFTLLQEEQTKQMYLRGVIARNVFHPYKECFNQLLKSCQDPTSLNINEGLKVLCGGLNREIPIYTNELLTENEILTNYSKLTAGIKNIQPKLGKILTDLQIEGLKKPIFKKIQEIKKDYIEIGYPRLLDWMP